MFNVYPPFPKSITMTSCFICRSLYVAFQRCSSNFSLYDIHFMCRLTIFVQKKQKFLYNFSGLETFWRWIFKFVIKSHFMWPLVYVSFFIQISSYSLYMAPYKARSPWISQKQWFLTRSNFFMQEPPLGIYFFRETTFGFLLLFKQKL